MLNNCVEHDIPKIVHCHLKFFGILVIILLNFKNNVLITE